MRYSRNYRIVSGFLVFATGALNFGIFPAVAARFFIYFCGLPDTFMLPGIPIHIATFPVVMAIDLLLALTFVTMGGQISVMVTECVQGIFTIFAFLIDHLVLEVIETILAKGNGSRLFREIREQRKLAYEVGSYSTTQRDNNMLSLYAITDRSRRATSSASRRRWRSRWPTARAPTTRPWPS